MAACSACARVSSVWVWLGQLGVFQSDRRLGGQGAGERGDFGRAQARGGVQQAEQADAAPVAGAQDKQVAGAVEKQGFFHVQTQGGGRMLDIMGGVFTLRLVGGDGQRTARKHRWASG